MRVDLIRPHAVFPDSISTVTRRATRRAAANDYRSKAGAWLGASGGTPAGDPWHRWR